MVQKNNTEFLINFAKYYKIKYAITYFYNVYGDREIEDCKYATVIAKFLKLKSKKTKYLEITRPGTQRRNFTHVKDIISGLVKNDELFNFIDKYKDKKKSKRIKSEINEIFNQYYHPQIHGEYILSRI